MEQKKKLVADVNIPYCISPERFTSAGQLVGTKEEKDAYLAAVLREVQLYTDELEDYEIHAVRLGGGAATVMKPDLLGRVLKEIRQRLPVSPRAEVSFDALPKTIGTPALTGIAAGHPNRAELMMRSSSSRELAALGCASSTEDFHIALAFLRKFGMRNIGVTVNCAFPGQTQVHWETTLRSCTMLHLPHITIEFGKDAGDDGFGFFDHACRVLKGAGYTQYAPGLFCQPGAEYRQLRLRYAGCDVLGLGLNAISVLDGVVTRNTNNPALYIKNAGSFDKQIAEVHTLSEDQIGRLYAANCLALPAGLDFAMFRERYPASARPLETLLPEFCRKDYLKENAGIFTPTQKGFYRYPAMRAALLS